MQPYDAIICGYFCMGFIDFMLKGDSLLDYTNLFSPNEYEKNDKVVLKYFQQLKRWKKLYCVICGKYRKFEQSKISYLLEKTLVLSIICSKWKKQDEDLKNLVWLKIYNYFKNMGEEKATQEFRLKNTDETRNDLTEEMNQIKLIS